MMWDRDSLIQVPNEDNSFNRPLKENSRLHIYIGSNSPKLLKKHKSNLRSLVQENPEMPNSHRSSSIMMDIPEERTDLKPIPKNNLRKFTKMNLALIPDSVFKSRELVYLNLSKNKIAHISRDIIGLNKLKILDLRNNLITEIPHFFCELGLQEIFLSFNRISRLCLRNFNQGAVRVLHVDGNEFFELDRSIFGFSALENLKLDWLKYCIPAKTDDMFSRKHEINTGIFKLESFLEGLRSILEGNNKRSVSCLDVLTHFSKESLVNFSDHIGRNLAQIATINKDYGVVWSLTQHSPKYMQKNDKKNRSLFYYILNIKNKHFTQKIFDLNPDLVSGYGEYGSALHIAAFNLDSKMTQKILKKDPDIDILDKYQNTALHKLFCVFDKHNRNAKVIADELIHAGMNLNEKNRKGHTPLSMAILFKNHKAVQYAVNKNLELDEAEQKFDFNALVGINRRPTASYAMKAGSLDLFQTFLSAKSLDIASGYDSLKRLAYQMGYSSCIYRKILDKRLRFELVKNYQRITRSEQLRIIRESRLTKKKLPELGGFCKIKNKATKSRVPLLFKTQQEFFRKPLSHSNIIRIQDQSDQDHLLLGPPQLKPSSNSHPNTCTNNQARSKKPTKCRLSLAENSDVNTKLLNITEMRANFDGTRYNKGFRSSKSTRNTTQICEDSDLIESSREIGIEALVTSIPFEETVFSKKMKDSCGNRALRLDFGDHRTFKSFSNFFNEDTFKRLVKIYSKHKQYSRGRGTFIHQRVQFYKSFFSKFFHLIDFERIYELIIKYRTELVNPNIHSKRTAYKILWEMSALQKLIKGLVKKAKSSFLSSSEFNIVNDLVFSNPEKFIDKDKLRLKASSSITNRLNLKIIPNHLGDILCIYSKQILRRVARLESAVNEGKVQAGEMKYFHELEFYLKNMKLIFDLINSEGVFIEFRFLAQYYQFTVKTGVEKHFNLLKKFGFEVYQSYFEGNKRLMIQGYHKGQSSRLRSAAMPKMPTPKFVQLNNLDIEDRMSFADN